MEPRTLRDDMVDGLTHESKAALGNERVALAMREVPRHEFVDEGARRAYLDRSFERAGSRVLAPSTVARLLDALAPEPGDETLVVGAGVGYTVAVIAEIVGARHVHAVEISRRLVVEARSNLAAAGYGDVLVDCRDGSEGLPEYAPFDRALLEAAAVEPPDAVLSQLAPGGRLVMPLGNADQSLAAVENDRIVDECGATRFAPLLVDGEQHGAIERNRTAREEHERAVQQSRSRSGWEYDWIQWDEFTSP